MPLNHHHPHDHTIKKYHVSLAIKRESKYPSAKLRQEHNIRTLKLLQYRLFQQPEKRSLHSQRGKGAHMFLAGITYKSLALRNH